jgi:hypothetical protein
MWTTRIVELTKKIPRFNDSLLRDFRAKKIETIPSILEDLFRQTTWVIDNHMGPDKPRLKYLGHRELPPDERAYNIRNKDKYARNYSIRPSQSRTLEFLFEFLGEKYPMMVEVPYIDNYAIMAAGVPSYPLFAIVERGGLYRCNNMVVIQVVRAKLRFWRENVEQFKTVEGFVFSEFNITAKIHQGGRDGKRTVPPLILHHLANHGFYKTMCMYGVADIITLSDKVVPEDGYQHVRVRDEVYLRLKTCGLTREVQRIVVGLLSIFKFWKKYTFQDLFEPGYYILATGKWYYPSVTNVSMLYDNACDYIRMNNTILDQAAMRQHASIGIKYNNLDELMLYMFYNIDRLVVEYNENSNNLFDKKIGTAELMLSPLIRKFNTRLLDKVINSKVGIKAETVKTLMYPQSYSQWMKKSAMFRGAPSIYNDNWLLAIGKYRFRTTANAEITDDPTGSNLPFELLRADPSFMVVESILTYPSSRPVESGSINPFLQVDDEGYIIRPPWADEIKDVFDR